jgi:hypothetical protein
MGNDAAKPKEIGAQLLKDILGIFYREGIENDESVPRISSLELVERLIAIKDRPWANMPSQGNAINPKTLAEILKPYGIFSKAVYEKGRHVQGYRIEDFWAVWYNVLDPWDLPQWLVMNGPPSTESNRGPDPRFREKPWDRQAPTKSESGIKPQSDPSQLLRFS